MISGATATDSLSEEKVMPLDMPLYLENMRKYLENRPKFPLDQLAPHAGRWIAWSPDGTRIVASAMDAEALEELIAAAGEDPLQCVQEAIPDHDTLLGGGFTREDP
jgi:hypothetical protein